MRVTVGSRDIEATVLAHQDGICWFGEADGRYTAARVDKVTGFKRAMRTVKPISVLEMRSRLRDEFGRDYDVQAAGRHVVVADRAIAARCARRCDEVTRAFKSYFARRSIPLSKAEYPLATVIARDQRSFRDMAAGQGVNATATLAGFYLQTSNRVLLYDPGFRSASLRSGEPPIVRMTRPGDAREILTPRPSEGMSRASDGVHPRLSNADLDATLVHETVHQLAFNMGLHSRTGDNPKWVVEGLATMLEPDSVRRNAMQRNPVLRINRERMIGFARRVRPAWENGRLAEIVASDRRFDTDTLDAYAEAWALTFFLSETRSSQYSALLRTLGQRRTLHDLTSRERTAMFRETFGSDIARLEVRWLRFMDELASASRLDQQAAR